MADKQTNDSLFEIFLFETDQNIKQLEQMILDNEKTSVYPDDAVNEIFRIMHTIKGSSAMMLFHNLSALAHQMENLFSYIRENKEANIDYRIVTDLVLEGIDFIKVELDKIRGGASPDGAEGPLAERIAAYFETLSKSKAPSGTATALPAIPPEAIFAGDGPLHRYKVRIFFEDGCQMESIRAFGIVRQLQEIAGGVDYEPKDIAESDNSVEEIRSQGLRIRFQTAKDYEEMQDFFLHTPFLREMQLDNDLEERKTDGLTAAAADKPAQAPQFRSAITSMISVNVNKLDQLMDLIGEMVIAQAMVLNNPDLKDLELKEFYKAGQQLKKITSEMQDVIMSVRMIPLTTIFQKNNRIVRDMCKHLGKEAVLTMTGEDTEVDKNIIEHISDPLMHLIRNALDHGIEAPEEREAQGKPGLANLSLSAWNEGGEVLISVSDDGRGLNKEKILATAAQKGLLTKKAEEMSDREIYHLIFLPGFSTNAAVTEYSGRGVGMDVVISNIEAVGGRVQVESEPGQGTKFTLRMPVTLAIIEGMNLRVGGSLYTMAVTDIRESFLASESEIFRDPDGNEMIMVRGECYPIHRLYEAFAVEPDSQVLDDGILIMVERADSTICLFVDELIGQQEVVVKPLPHYIKSIKKINGLAGCALLGDGRISLILDAAGF